MTSRGQSAKDDMMAVQMKTFFTRPLHKVFGQSEEIGETIGQGGKRPLLAAETGSSNVVVTPARCLRNKKILHCFDAPELPKWLKVPSSTNRFRLKGMISDPFLLYSVLHVRLESKSYESCLFLWSVTDAGFRSAE